MSSTSRSRLRAVLALAAALLVGVGGGYWVTNRLVSTSAPADSKTSSTDAGHAHEGEHDHGHAGHDEGASLELSNQARSNIGLQMMKIEPQTFEKTITIPGMITERPGRTTIEVTAPMTGVITRLAAVQGQAVEPGELLAEMRLTHEELVQAQGDLLKTAESLDVLRREIARVEGLTRDGAIAGKALIDLNYEKQKSEAVLHAQSQTLLLHGLSEEQVNGIIKSQKLIQNLIVLAPSIPDVNPNGTVATSIQVQELRVAQGQHVNAGEVLFVLADHHELFIEGRAFEQDVQAVSTAVANDWQVSALVESRTNQPEDVLTGLNVLYMANKVDPDSRAFRFYVTLPNQLLREKKSPDGRKFLDWKFKPGQRVQVRVPTEQWQDRIVVPIEAVATEGTESYVFQANGDHFDRRPVHVEYRDQLWAVIANDGSIFPGDMIAKSGAFQLQTALKNKAGGAIDPHAGHNH